MDIDAIVLPRQQRLIGLALSEAYAKHGEEATYANARKIILSRGLERTERYALADQISTRGEQHDLIDWNRFPRHGWLTREEADSTALRLLTALMPDGAEIHALAASGVPVRQIFELYPRESIPMMNTLRRALAAMDEAALNKLHAELAPFEPKLLKERMEGNGLLLKQLSIQSWVRIQLPDNSVERATTSLMAILSHIFTWHRMRDEPPEFAVGWQLNYVHLTDAFLDLWENLAQPSSGK